MNIAALNVELTYAFQPIVDVKERNVFSYEALLRGKNNEPASFILSQISEKELLVFDQHSRNVAIKLASELGISCYINLNFIPIALQESEKYIKETISAFEKNCLSVSQLVIEITEEGIIRDYNKFTKLINEFRSANIKFAIDDFGAGYSGLNLLANFQPDMIKLDMQLIRNISTHGPRQAIVKAIIEVCFSLGIDVIAEGVESVDEYHWLTSHGIYLIQGYLLAKADFEKLRVVHYIDSK